MIANQSPIFIGKAGLVNVVNAVGKFLQFFGIHSFNLDAPKILKQATKKSGFEFESKSMRDGLECLVQSLQREANLDTFGKFLFKSQIKRAAIQRFKVEKALFDNPDITNQPINKPLFIIGMPRTGTTILHALLSCDNVTRSPLAWECLLPHPVPNPNTYNDNPQYKQIKKEFNYLFKLIPDLQKKHYIEADSPQECVGINALDFNSFQYLAQCYMPSYRDWFVNDSNKLETMKWHKRFFTVFTINELCAATLALKITNSFDAP